MRTSARYDEDTPTREPMRRSDARRARNADHGHTARTRRA